MLGCGAGIQGCRSGGAAHLVGGPRAAGKAPLGEAADVVAHCCGHDAIVAPVGGTAFRGGGARCAFRCGHGLFKGPGEGA